jgi:DNA-binding winged helix-turn-helix (wHTH) protein
MPRRPLSQHDIWQALSNPNAWDWFLTTIRQGQPDRRPNGQWRPDFLNEYAELVTVLQQRGQWQPAIIDVLEPMVRDYLAVTATMAKAHLSGRCSYQEINAVTEPYHRVAAGWDFLYRAVVRHKLPLDMAFRCIPTVQELVQAYSPDLTPYLPVLERQFQYESALQRLEIQQQAGTAVILPTEIKPSPVLLTLDRSAWTASYRGEPLKGLTRTAIRCLVYLAEHPREEVEQQTLIDAVIQPAKRSRCNPETLRTYFSAFRKACQRIDESLGLEPVAVMPKGLRKGYQLFYLLNLDAEQIAIHP